MREMKRKAFRKWVECIYAKLRDQEKMRNGFLNLEVSELEASMSNLQRRDRGEMRAVERQVETLMARLETQRAATDDIQAQYNALLERSNREKFELAERFEQESRDRLKKMYVSTQERMDRDTAKIQQKIDFASVMTSTTSLPPRGPSVSSGTAGAGGGTAAVATVTAVSKSAESLGDAVDLAFAPHDNAPAVDQFLSQQQLRASSEDALMRKAESRISDTVSAVRLGSAQDIKIDLATEVSERLLRDG